MINPCKQLLEAYHQLTELNSSQFNQGGVEFSLLRNQQAIVERYDLFREYQKQAEELFFHWHQDADFIDTLRFEPSGRVIVAGDLDLTGAGKQHFPSLIRVVEGDLSLANNRITNIDYLESVGTLEIEEDQVLQSLHCLENAGALSLKNCAVKDLSSLRVVNDRLEVMLGALKELPSLEKANKLTFVRSKISRIPELTTAAGNLRIIDCAEISSLDKLTYCFGKLEIRNCSNFSSLPRLKEVKWKLDLHRCLVETLPELVRIGGHLSLKRLWLSSDQFDDFEKLFPSLVEIGYQFKNRATNFFIIGWSDSTEFIEQVDDLKQAGKIKVHGILSLKR